MISHQELIGLESESRLDVYLPLRAGEFREEEKRTPK